LAINGSPVRAHRAAYELAHGPIKDGMLVCHRCDNPKCVNVDHLFLGTNDDNMKDCKRKGRTNMGERHPLCKLTSSEVAKIRELKESGMSVASISRMLKRGYSTVYAVVRRYNWASI